MSPFNGKTKIAVVSAACTVILCAGSIGGWVIGWKTKVQVQTIREQKWDDHLLEAERGMMRLVEVEKQAGTTTNEVKNLDENVRTLVQSQERTTQAIDRMNERLDKLNEALMDYLAAQARRRP